MKIREVFEYEVDTDNFDEVFTIYNYVDCVDDMCTPFWDGYKHPEIKNHTCVILNEDIDAKN